MQHGLDERYGGDAALLDHLLQDVDTARATGMVVIVAQVALRPGHPDVLSAAEWTSRLNSRSDS